MDHKFQMITAFVPVESGLTFVEAENMDELVNDLGVKREECKVIFDKEQNIPYSELTWFKEDEGDWYVAQIDGDGNHQGHVFKDYQGVVDALEGLKASARKKSGDYVTIYGPEGNTL